MICNGDFFIQWHKTTQTHGGEGEGEGAASTPKLHPALYPLLYSKPSNSEFPTLWCHTLLSQPHTHNPSSIIPFWKLLPSLRSVQCSPGGQCLPAQKVWNSQGSSTFPCANSHVLVPSWSSESTFPMDTGIAWHIPAGNSLKYWCFNLIPVLARPWSHNVLHGRKVPGA